MRLIRSSLVRLTIPGVALGLLWATSAGCKPSSDSGSATPAAGASASGTETTSAAPQDTTGSEIEVGEYASMTGDTATFGTQSDSGMQFALEELNSKGGMLGKKFKIDREDDRSLPDEAKTIATQFSANAKVVAVIGEVASTRSLNAAPVLQRAGIPMISPSSTNPDVTKVGDYIFRVCFIDPFQGFVMAKFAHDDLKANKVAVMRDQSSDYSVGLADVFKEEFAKAGGTITADVSYNAKDPDFRSQLGQIKDKGADAIFIPGYYGEVGTIARQARGLGINAPLLGGDGWDSDKLVEGAGGPGKALEGCYFSTHYSKDDKTPRVQEFVKRYAAAHGGQAPAALVAQGYDAMMILADAIKRANSTDRAKIKDALAATKNYPGITGNITINDERNAIKSAVVLQIKGNDFQFVKSVAPVIPPAKSASRQVPPSRLRQVALVAASGRP